MLLRTRGLIDIYLKQLKKSLKILTFSAQIFSIVYLALMLLLGSGVWMVNIVLIALCVSSILFDILTYDKKDKKTKKIRKKTKKNIKWAKLATKSVSVGFAVYGIYTASTEEKTIVTILATVSVIVWLIQILFALVCSFLEKRKEEVLNAFMLDIEPIITGYNLYQKIRGGETIDINVSAKDRIKFAGMAAEQKEKIEIKKAESAAKRKEKSLLGLVKKEIGNAIINKLVSKKANSSLDFDVIETSENKEENILPEENKQTITK